MNVFNYNSKFLTNKGVNVELSNKCRLKCSGCLPRLDVNNLKGITDIPFNQAKVIYDTFHKVSMCGNMSDPIYHPEFLKSLEYMSKNGNRLRIHTNGSGKTKEWWQDAFNLSIHSKEQITWYFGVDGLPKDSHIYRVNQDGEQVWEMMKLGSSMGVDIVWQLIVFNYNENDIEKCKQMAKDHNMHFVEIHSTRWDWHPHLKPSNVEYTMNRRTDMTKQLRKNKIEIDPECLNTNVPKDVMFINKGFFVPCCECDTLRQFFDFEKFGFFQNKFHISNLNTPQDIKDVFDSNEWNNFHETITHKNELAPKICQEFCQKLPKETKQHGRDNDYFAH